MLNPKIRFSLYAAFKYFKFPDKDGKAQGLRPATIASWTGIINLTTIYRWEKDYNKTDWKTLKDKDRERVQKIQGRVRRMHAKIDRYLEDQSKTPEEFFEDLRIVCAIIHICNKASIRGLWEFVDKKKVEKIQDAIRDAAAIVNVAPEKIKAENVAPEKIKVELVRRIEALASVNAMD